MSIVARGLGLPEDGALVAGGFGTSEVDANAMSAALSGTSTLTATLTAAGEPVTPDGDPGGGGRRFIRPGPRRPLLPAQPVRRDMQATLVGWSSVSASLTFTINFDEELEQLLLAGVL